METLNKKNEAQINCGDKNSQEEMDSRAREHDLWEAQYGRRAYWAEQGVFPFDGVSEWKKNKKRRSNDPYLRVA